jgi:folate-binding protein YgfZ
VESLLHDYHQILGAHFTTVNGVETVADYGDPETEQTRLRSTAGILDLSCRGRLCLTGADRARFLHGQVTNDIKRLGSGEGCYTAIVDAKGKLQADATIFCLPEELLLDLEPGLNTAVAQRLEKFLVADDVQIVDVTALYGLLSVQGPKAEEVVRAAGLTSALPAREFNAVQLSDPRLGETYLVNLPRLATSGFDLFAPAQSQVNLTQRLLAAAGSIGGGAVGWQALETVRVEAGIPRFGVDMDQANFPQEAGIDGRAVSYNKGCYVGQETLNRIHTMGHVNRLLCGLRWASDLASLPAKGDPLYLTGREVGYITSAVRSAHLHANLALGYVRREASQPGTRLTLRAGQSETSIGIVELPFRCP